MGGGGGEGGEVDGGGGDGGGEGGGGEGVGGGWEAEVVGWVVGFGEVEVEMGGVAEGCGGKGEECLCSHGGELGVGRGMWRCARERSSIERSCSLRLKCTSLVRERS